MVVLSMSDQEAVVLRQLIDAAVRGLGIKAAEAGLYFDAKIGRAIEEAAILASKANGSDKSLGAVT